MTMPTTTAPCANHPGQESTETCKECGKPLCGKCLIPLAENRYCAACVEAASHSLSAALDDMRRNPNYLGALALGLLAAIAGGWIWERVATVFNLQIGIISIVIGVAVGRAVVAGAGNKRGTALQVISVILTAAGMALGILMETHSAVLQLIADGKVPSDVNAWAGSILILPSVVMEMGVMTWVIAAIGLWEGWKTPGMPALQVSDPA